MIIVSIGSFFSGRGPYVVIDNRNKFNDDDNEDTSSNEGLLYASTNTFKMPEHICISHMPFV